MSKQILVVGGGPAGVSVCAQLVESLKKHSIHEVEIIVLEKSGRIGPGLPYSGQDDDFILNLPKQSMTLTESRSGQFSAWVDSHKTCPKDTDFVPRHYFGEYLEMESRKILIEAEDSGIILKYHTHCEALSVKKLANDQFEVETTQISFKVDYIIFCTGHLPGTTYSEFSNHERYKGNVWRPEEYSCIDRDAPVGILGTRLTAIDLALKLKTLGHQGKIFMVSRSGLLPAVLGGKILERPMKYLTLNSLNRLTKMGLEPLELNKFTELFWLEISEAEKCIINFTSISKSSKDVSPIDWLKKEISTAEAGSKPWQEVLFAMYPIISNIWLLLSPQDQKLFFEKYYSIFITYLAAFPLDNAYKIKRLMESNQVEVFGDLKKIHQNPGDFLIETTEKNIPVSYLFNATGQGYDPDKIPLYRTMSGCGLITKHPLGGVVVDPQTLGIIDSNNISSKKMFCIGEITRGTCLATTDMGRVVAQAGRVTSGISSQLQSQPISQVPLTRRFFGGGQQTTRQSQNIGFFKLRLPTILRLGAAAVGTVTLLTLSCSDNNS